MKEAEMGTITIAPPVVHPFIDPSVVRCRACSRYIPLWSRFWAMVLCKTPSAVEVEYCPGGKEPTDEVGGLQAQFSGITEHRNPCAGVNEPHLHCECRMCKYSWLTRTKDAI